MTRNNDDHSDNSYGLSPERDTDSIGKNQRHEPKFGRFEEDDEDEYEEPDRDTDFASGYHSDSVEEEGEIEDSFPDEEERDLFPGEKAKVRYEPDESVADEPDAWLEKEGYLEEEEDSTQNWPLSLIAVAAVALVLLVAGGYGVMQQRAATEEELTQLRAALATSAGTQDKSASREALQELQRSYDKLAANAEALALENHRLADTVTGLEAQLGAQQAVLTKTVSPAEPAKPASAQSAAPAVPKAATKQPAAAKPSAPRPAAATSSGPWFVNFGSYGQRAMAETWATRLHPIEGRVIIAPNTRDGKTLYRVRVVGLPDRDSAQRVARKLEADLKMSELWVGKE